MTRQWTNELGSGRPATAHAPLSGERRAGFMPMLVGGLMVAVGLMAFLFYDDRPESRDVDATASTRPAITEPAKPAPDRPAVTPARP